MVLKQPRTRKLAGSIALGLFVIVYALVAAVIGAAVFTEAHKAIEAIYYLVAGLAWIFPARAMIRWMQPPA